MGLGTSQNRSQQLISCTLAASARNPLRFWEMGHLCTMKDFLSTHTGCGLEEHLTLRTDALAYNSTEVQHPLVL